MNCRSVSPKTWEHARQALVFYFVRRKGAPDAEDLAQETLATILGRDDFQFEKEEDFLKVCYAFAGHILQTAQRKAGKSLSNSPSDSDLVAPGAEAHGLKDAELNVFLKEVFRLGKEQLRDADWNLIRRSIVLDGDTNANADPAGANNARVRLHRARKKLALLTGWRKA